MKSLSMVRISLSLCLSAALLLFACIRSGEASQSSYNVSIQLKLNVAGVDYSVYADDNEGTGTYYENDMDEYYSCLNTSQGYVTGIVFMGRRFDYLKLENLTTNYLIRMGQSLGGNKFIIPITQSYCSDIDSRMESVSDYMTGAFNPFVQEGAYEVSIIMGYPGVDFVTVGNDEDIGSGEFYLSLEKNQSGSTVQIIVDKT